MNSFEIDFDKSIECSRGCLTFPFEELPSESLLNSSDLMESCPGGLHQDVEPEKEVGIGDEDSFNLSAFLVEYTAAGDDFLNVANGLSSEEEEDDKLERKKSLPTPGNCDGEEDSKTIILEFRQVIEKQDAQIEFLILNLEEMTLAKEDKEKESLKLSHKIEVLEDELRRVTENLELERSEYGPSEMSSYFLLPQTLSTREGMSFLKHNLSQETQTALPPTQTHVASQHELHTTESATQFSQPLLKDTATETVSFAAHMTTQTTILTKDASSVANIRKDAREKWTETLPLPILRDSASQGQPPETTDSATETLQRELIDAGIQHVPTKSDTSHQASLPDPILRKSLGDLEESIGVIRDEIQNLRQNVSIGVGSFLTTDLVEMSNAILKHGNSLEEKKNAEIEELKKIFGREQKVQEEREAFLKTQLDEAKLRSRRSLEGKEEEILELKIKVAQFEYSKKSSEGKLASFSSRLSPEGSELDISGMDTSLSEANQTHKGLSESDDPLITKPNYEITRTKMEYLALTPPLDLLDDGETHLSTARETPNTIIEDLRLQVVALEKKCTANEKYLEEQTNEREIERDDFQRQRVDFEQKLEELRKEFQRLEEARLNLKEVIEDLEQRLTESTEAETQLGSRALKLEAELQSAIDKIYQLREIIQDLESEIDSSTTQAGALKEENQFLREEVEFLQKEAEAGLNASHETFVTANAEFTADELQAQIKDLTNRLEKKLIELDNFKWSSPASRPSSACSTLISVSSEDISLKDQMEGTCERDVTAADVADGIRRLDVQFDNFVKFEEIMMKKLRDTEIRLRQTLQRQEELETEKVATQEKLKEQLLKVSDLESRLDQLRFEPSPQTLTLGGLRTRIKWLTEELGNVKGELQLKNMQLEDVKEKMAAKEALLSKVEGGRRAAFPKLSISTQTECLQQSASAQTVSMFPMSRQDACAQTTDAKGLPFFRGEADELELSSIPGGPQPTHSTPNEDLPKRKLKSATRNDYIQSLEEGKGSPERLRASQNQNQTAHVFQESFNVRNHTFQRENSNFQRSIEFLIGMNCYQIPTCLQSTEATTKQTPIPSVTPRTSSASGKLTWTQIQCLVNSNSPTAQLPHTLVLQTRVSSNSLHGVDSVDDIRSWSLSAESRRKHFLAQMLNGRDSENQEITSGGELAEVMEVQNIDEILDPPLRIESKVSLKARSSEHALPPYSEPGKEQLKGTGVLDSSLPPPTASLQDTLLPSHEISSMHESMLTSESQDSVPGGAAVYENGLSSEESAPEELFSSEKVASLEEVTSLEELTSPEDVASLEEVASFEELTTPEHVTSLEELTTPEHVTSLEEVASLEKVASLEEPISTEEVTSVAISGESDFVENSMEENIAVEGIGSPIIMAEAEIGGALSETILGVENGQSLTEEITKTEAPSLLNSSPNGAPLPPLPCIPRNCEEALLLQEIDKLKKENVVLETKLEVFMENPPPLRTTPPLPVSYSRPVELPVVQRPPGNMECSLAKTPAHEELLRQLAQLKQEKAQVEAQFAAGGSEELQRLLNEEQRKCAASNKRMELLKREREEKESRVRQLEETSVARAKQVETLLTQMECEKGYLETEVKKVKKDLEQEAKERRVVQTSYNSAKESLQKHLAQDRHLRLENEELMNELIGLRQFALTQQEAESVVHSQANALAQQQAEAMLQAEASMLAQKHLQRQGAGQLATKENLDNLELYLRAKSYRKALTWQKKYLGLVIQGYRGLLEQIQPGFEHSQIHVPTIPLSPTTLGLIDARAPTTRFRIVSKAVLATVRMKFMVRRWDSRSRRLGCAGKEPLLSRQGKKSTDLRRRVVPGLSLSSLSGVGSGEVETVLSDYLRRIHTLETELGGVLNKRT